MLEVAAAMVGERDYPNKQARISLREQGGSSWPVTLFGSDSANVISEVADGSVQFAIINPATAAAPAERGVPPFDRPVPLRAIATLPSFDQLGLAVRSDSGIERLQDIVRRRVPLRVSLRAQRDHSVHLLLNHVLAASDMSLSDIEAAGGVVRYDEGLVHFPLRAGLIETGEVDAVFDEGVYNWIDLATSSGMRFLPLDDDVLERLEQMGYRRGTIEAARHPSLREDVPALDFSGFLIVTHADVGDELVTRFCDGLLARSHAIEWQGGIGLPLEHMLGDAVDAPIAVPFHPAAAEFWGRHDLLPR